ncbi:2-methylcitrate dehydratase PrpD [Halorientalis persicus]|uniref:2-methylcitrate dehydratase PrpD n=1 Tax=Halorientalis persicus TaxID=1367881 RepID=A0A1H8MUK4_9EURY|nr:MmgE/PrpD family protein [Halorientalis persicus]SEO20876.1 2-methylcitrate dehydratase PrpD [Halorientalis persicus]
MTRPEAVASEFVADLSYADLPKSVVKTVERAFLDTVGVTLAGAVEGAGRTVASAAEITLGDAAAGTLLGVTTDESPAEAALRVGTASHALDYDDLSWAMDGHPSVTLVPPLLAVAEMADANGRDLITAFVAGFETECAVAGPVSPAHYEAGWHATATFGTFGAAAAVAHLLDQDAAAIERALTAAASMPAGLKRNFGSETKPLHAGLCSRAGVTAARLAHEGLTADDAAISGERGFWDLYGPDERGTFSIGERFRLREEGIHVKAFPCCYFTHTAIAATQALTADLAPDAVDRIEVAAARGAADALHHADPDTGLEAKFSMEYCVASGVVRDRVGLAAFRDDAIDDPGVQRVRERVAFDVDESLPYDSHASVVRVDTTDGTRERRQEDPPGTHENPLSDGELRTKFAECAGVVLTETAVDTLYDRLSSLRTAEDATAAVTVDGQ